MKISFENKKWEIFFWINILWILGTIGLIIITHQSTPPDGSNTFIESAKVAFLSLGCLGVILPTFLSIFHSIEVRKNDLIENTFKLIESWDNPLLLEARKFSREIKASNQPLSDEELLAKINDDPNLKQSVILVVNYFDQIRISLKNNRIDKNIIQDSMGPISKDIHRWLLPYVISLGEVNEKHWNEFNQEMNRTD